MNVQDFYKYAKFSTLAYVDWRESSKLEPEDAIEDANTAKRVPGNTTDADVNTLGEKLFIQDGWRIASFQPNKASGFAASLFANSATGEKVLAIRGTEPSGSQAYPDLLKADLQEIGEYGMAISQAVDMFNYVQKLRAPVTKTDVVQLELQVGFSAPTTGQYVTVLGIPPRYISVIVHNDGQGLGELIKPTDSVAVTGHSLGGHLAAAAYRLFPGLFDAGVTFNAPGFDPLLGVSNLPSLTNGVTTWGRQLTDDFVSQLFSPNLTDAPASSFSALLNMHSMVSEDTVPGDDTSIVSSLITGTPASQHEPITTERNSHMIEPLMDALAVQSLIEQMNPTIGIAGAGMLVKAASNNPGKSEEELLDAFSKLLLGDLPKLVNSPNDIADGADFWINAGDFAKRTTIHNRIIQLEQHIESAPGLSLASLVTASQNTITTKAQQDDAEGIAYRYALTKLTPFAITGADYSTFNATGELNRYDPASGTGNLTNLCLADRAAMLLWKVQYDTTDKAYSAKWGTFAISGDWDFIDHGTLIDELDTLNYTPLKLAIDGFSPTTTDNHQIVFGDSASNTLTGSGDTDHLYGGAGADILTGNGAADYLEGGTGTDTYLINPGDGNDTLLDTDGLGSIVYNGNAITGGTKLGPNNWWNITTNVSYTLVATSLNTNDLLIDVGNEHLTVKDFTTGELGINLAGTVSLSDGQTSNGGIIYYGDRVPFFYWDMHYTPPSSTWPYVFDTNGNIARGSTTAYDWCDKVYDTPYDDVIYAGDGVNVVYANKGGNNYVESGRNLDYILGGGGRDIVYSGGMSDTVIVAGGNDIVYGQDGGDVIDGGASNDLLVGGADADAIDGGAGDDEVYAGDPLVWAQAIADGGGAAAGQGELLAGGDGTDTVAGDRTNDALFGGEGRDRLAGREGDDIIMGDSGVGFIMTPPSWFDGLINAAYWPLMGPADGNTFSPYSTAPMLDIQFQKIDHGAGVNRFEVKLSSVINDSFHFITAPIAGANDGDQLYGGSGNDWLFGEFGEDTLVGGAGDDAMVGGEGSDTYIINAGEGVDIIADTFPVAGTNTLVFGAGVDQSLITLFPGSLGINLGNGNAIHIEGVDYNDIANTCSIGRFVFSDGTVLSAQQLVARGFEVNGGSGGDTLRGTNVEDRIDGGAGDDTIEGGKGNDTYWFGSGSGQDTVTDSDATVGNSDTIRVKAGLSPADVALWREGGDLCLGINNTSDRITVRGWFDDPANRVEQVQFSDGTVWGAAILEAALSNSITGTAANDTLIGTGGVDALDGGAGRDRMAGGKGDDTYIVNSSGDQVVELAGEGVDVVKAGASFTLAANDCEWRKAA